MTPSPSHRVLARDLVQYQKANRPEGFYDLMPSFQAQILVCSLGREGVPASMYTRNYRIDKGSSKERFLNLHVLMVDRKPLCLDGFENWDDIAKNRWEVIKVENPFSWDRTSASLQSIDSFKQCLALVEAHALKYPHHKSLAHVEFFAEHVRLQKALQQTPQALSNTTRPRM